MFWKWPSPWWSCYGWWRRPLFSLLPKLAYSRTVRTTRQETRTTLFLFPISAYKNLKYFAKPPLVKIYKRSLSKSRSVFGRISRRDGSDRCRRFLSIFGRISRRDWSDRSGIAVVDRLAFLAEVPGALERSRRDRCHRSQMVFGRISRRDHGPDEKDKCRVFLISEEEQWAENCPESCRNIVLTCDKWRAYELCRKSCIIENDHFVWTALVRPVVPAT